MSSTVSQSQQFVTINGSNCILAGMLFSLATFFSDLSALPARRGIVTAVRSPHCNHVVVSGWREHLLPGCG